MISGIWDNLARVTYSVYASSHTDSMDVKSANCGRPGEPVPDVLATKAAQREATTAALIAAARALFAERGYAGVGTEEIVQRAGVTRGALYHHFKGGKEELFRAVLVQVSAETTARVARPPARRRTRGRSWWSASRRSWTRARPRGAAHHARRRPIGARLGHLASRSSDDSVRPARGKRYSARWTPALIAPAPARPWRTS